MVAVATHSPKSLPGFGSDGRLAALLNEVLGHVSPQEFRH
jgi:hypothetical protein